jgi:hypothetical protein
MSDKALALIDKAEQMLEEASELTDVIDFRKTMSAAAVAAHVLGFKEAAQKAKIYQLKAERKAGEMLATMKENGERAGRGNPQLSQIPTPAVFDDFGVTTQDASRWQQIAALPKEKFDGWIDEQVKNGWEITLGGLRNYAKSSVAKETRNSGVRNLSAAEATEEVALALMKNAIDERDASWLLSAECVQCLAVLGVEEVNYLLAWAEQGCPTAQEMMNKRLVEGWEKTKKWRAIAR